jgi:endoglucanase
LIALSSSKYHGFAQFGGGMFIPRRRLAALAALAVTTICAAPSARAEPATGFTPVDPAVQARSLGRGVNVLGFDPIWKDLAARQFKPEHFARIRAAGFTTVRVVLFGFAHMDAQDRLDPRWLQTLDKVVDEALANDLNVILENQDMAWCGQHAGACRPRLRAFWAQVAEREKDRPSRVLFELLNEPNGQIDPVWNAWIPELLEVIRRSNPTRNVVVDAAGWANLEQLDRLQLPPADRHLIATIHYYEPRPFTHQGTTFAEPELAKLSNVAWGSPEDYRKLHADFSRAQTWATTNERPLLLGEFGAFEKAPMPSRVRYYSAVAREAEAQGWSWIMWQFAHDFAVYDMAHDRWVEPIRDALVPKG